MAPTRPARTEAPPPSRHTGAPQTTANHEEKR